jgi:hypothetical protein
VCVSETFFSALSPERDNYRFLVLWEELGDRTRLDKADILNDHESWSASRDAALACASAAAEAQADRESQAAIEAESASRAKAKADADAAAELLNHRFLSMHRELEKTRDELQSLRARAAKVVCDMDPAASSCTGRRDLDASDRLVPTLAGARMMLADDASTGSASADLTENNESPGATSLPVNDDVEQRNATSMPNVVTVTDVDAHVVAAAYNQRRKHHGFPLKSSEDVSSNPTHALNFAPRTTHTRSQAMK